MTLPPTLDTGKVPQPQMKRMVCTRCWAGPADVAESDGSAAQPDKSFASLYFDKPENRIYVTFHKPTCWQFIEWLRGMDVRVP